MQLMTCNNNYMLLFTRRHVPSLLTLESWEAELAPEIQALKVPSGECRMHENWGAKGTEWGGGGERVYSFPAN